ncbi:hypothetical protein [Leclercia adecarboxylata]|uniref:hypothetical protein n=1 Tax=Leclercia adecarboxylata TaxID=83655 RepID=UPI0013DF351E|nr:hypothetical protein [Leclercia adecarboxylata]MDU1652254.1 hypothetical protein [Leclercia adecarboxylata]MDU2019238.1 hypothetical protein [Leclercia adecarboxylata]QIG29387.1 hypothetical protein FY044_14460 [Leclercia adecarboxylata]
MKDLYLRFADAAEMRTQLIQAGFEVDEDQGGLYHPDISLDVVGVITTSIGDAESVEYVTEPGYHVNLRVINDGLDLSKLDDFVVSPKTPARVWA